MPLLSSDVAAGQHGTAISFTNLRSDVKQGNSTIVTPADAAPTVINLDLSNQFVVTLSTNRTLSVTGGTVGQRFTIRVNGAYSVTWFAGIDWEYAITPAQTATAGYGDWYGFICKASGHYDGFILGQKYAI